MENFIVSARKYRPNTFDTVVGQESITNTLKNAIKTSHLAQAYLFCGPRGVGKTTCARILAKTINCQNLSENVEACDQCESCNSFNTSRSFNIHELDAASNNKVDDIRTLTDQVRIPPQVGKYSIYIIDEVHMLSTSAFNAFLKTLEEPPPHAIFILATTEKQKIIPTILSRCQIFDFQRITIDDISSRLRYVTDQEGVEAEQEALNVIAQKADGAMRDALSIFDQIVSFSGRQITYKNVIENLNVLDHEYYLRITEAFNKGDVSNSLLIFNEILEKGFDGHNFVAGLGSHFRNLLVAGDKATIGLIEVGSKVRERYISQRAGCNSGFLYEGLEILSNCDIYYKSSRNQRLHVELALIKLCNISDKTIKKENKTETEIEPKAKTPEQKEVIAETVAATTEKEVKQSGKETVREGGNKVEHPLPADRISVTEKKVISIKDALTNGNSSYDTIKEEQGSDYKTDKEIVSDNKFSFDDLINAWNSFGVKLKDRSPRMSSIIQAMHPLLQDNSKIELQLKTEAQKDYFDKNFKADMIDYLKGELKNRNISFDTIVVEGDDNSVPYTMEQKYEHLSKKNPLVDKLKKDFLLDYD